MVYKDGVYDITEWVETHPGGKEKIMLAAGGSIEPFWAMYQQHQTQQVGRADRLSPHLTTVPLTAFFSFPPLFL